MIHSIIIPHRGRERHLAACLWSIEHSRDVCGFARDALEFLVVDADDPFQSRVSATGIAPWSATFLFDPDHPALFNKPRLLNLGLRHALGDVITFLDADALVGPRFLEAAVSGFGFQVPAPETCNRNPEPTSRDCVIA